MITVAPGGSMVATNREERGNPGYFCLPESGARFVEAWHRHCSSFDAGDLEWPSLRLEPRRPAIDIEPGGNLFCDEAIS